MKPIELNHWNYPLVFSFLSCKLRRTLKCFERRYWGKSHHIYEEKNCHVVPVTNNWFTLTDIFFYVFLLLLRKLNIIKNRLNLGMFANIVGKWARRMWPSKIKYKGPSNSLDKYVEHGKHGNNGKLYLFHLSPKHSASVFFRQFLFFCINRIWKHNRSLELVTWENSRHFVTSLLVSPRNDVCETNAEILYRWRATGCYEN